MSGPFRVLATAFAAVPGSSPHGAALLALVDALRGDLDLVTLKTEDLSHIKRIGDARMFRVPVGSGPRAAQREAFARAVARQIEAEPYQVVHVLDPWSGAVAADRAKSRGYELLYELATLPEADEEASWLPAHRKTLAAASRVLVPTNAAARALGKSAVAGRVEVVRPGVDVGTYDHVETSALGAPRILYLGPLAERRDLGTMLEAIGRVASHRPVRALLAGERRRERRQEVRDAIAERGLASVIDVRGEPHPRSLPHLISAADVCLAPSADQRVDGVAALPQPMLEYCACYRPVVAADLPGVSELIRDEVEGLLYPPGEAGALADAILEVLRDAPLRERLTEAAYHRVRTELSAGARRRRIRRLYEERAPGTQYRDPWEERFEEITGMIELSTSALEALQEGPDEEPEPPAIPEPDTDAAARRPRRGGAGQKTIQDLAPPTTDTQPGLVVPDTDPGRR